ncbi:MFS transporter [Ruania alba]|uniref:Major Facilitator Superfamily protein n=1 Tax=Ruania alba TaxID=648782 RepID=A0A1H5N1D6_9MICO|nr:MFS transporter [Ruania alba]SEE94757.1 Major Facilitator Superfamily protein [Ruania alba]
MTAGARLARESLWTPSTWPFITSVLALMTFIAFEAFAVTTVLPVAMTELGGPQWYSLAYAATMTAALVGMVTGGNWADHAGPRAPLRVGGTLFLAGLALCVVAPDAATFIVGRLMQGIGGGIDSVVLYVLIARRIPERARPRMFGLLTAAWLIPSMAGPVLAGALTELMSWRTVFALILVGAAISLLLLLFVTRSPAPRIRASAREVVGRKGVLSLVAALLLVTLHVGGQLGSSISTMVVLPGVIALAVTAWSILPPGTLALRGVPQRLVALRAILGATVTATNVYLTLYLQTERGYPPTTAGLVIAVGALGWASGAWLQGRFSSGHRAHRRLVFLATALVAAGPVGALLYVVTDLPVWAVVAGGIAMGVGMGIAYPRLSSATLALVEAPQHGAYSSALQAGESMSVGATTALAAVVLATTLSTDASFALVNAMLIGLAVAGTAIASSTEWEQRRSVSPR